MSSVTSTGICFLPLYTPNVSPTNCGRIVERRDQVLITSLRTLPRAFSAFLIRLPSTNGPFQTERATAYLLARRVTATDDELVRSLVLAGLLALGGLAPRGHRVAAARGLALAAAVRMIDRVHGNTTHDRPMAEPAGAAGLADHGILVVRVRNRTDGRQALGRDQAQLAGAELELGVAGVLADQLGVGAGGARQLAAAALLQLDVMHDRADRHVGERHGVARLDVDTVARHHFVAGLETLRGDDVGELPVGVLDERDERRAIRVVLETLDRARDVELAALEVDQAQAALVAAAAMMGGDVAVVVAAAGLGLAGGQRLDRLALPQAVAVDDHQLSQRRRDRLECLESHYPIPRPTGPWSRRSCDLRPARRSPSSSRCAHPAGP